MGHKHLRVLYSFPHKLGADRICYTAWQQVNGLAAAGAELFVHTGVLHRPVPEGVRVRPTLAWGKLRIPYKLIGTMRACILHDYIVSRRIEKLAGQIDIVHTWPLAAMQTLKSAAQLGIPTVLERPNSHTRFGYETVQKECEKLGLTLPKDDEHSFRTDVLEREEKEYRAAFRILCPSDFVTGTFLQQGFPRESLLRHTYGFDEERFYPGERENGKIGITLLFVGTGSVVKGLHYALEAWLRSPAHETGAFLIAGGFSQPYAQRLASFLTHPSIRLLGHRNDIPELMRRSDILILPSITEGFGLVCAEAIACGCVPVVSEACTEICRHMENSLVHPVGDVDILTEHLTRLSKDRSLLRELRIACIAAAPQFTWKAAGERLLHAYYEAIGDREKYRG